MSLLVGFVSKAVAVIVVIVLVVAFAGHARGHRAARGRLGPVRGSGPGRLACGRAGTSQEAPPLHDGRHQKLEGADSTRATTPDILFGGCFITTLALVCKKRMRLVSLSQPCYAPGVLGVACV